jgi:transcriptional regulator with XRE-family HTH domain/tetratricopeptide (TPR) repeat protein
MDIQKKRGKKSFLSNRETCERNGIRIQLVREELQLSQEELAKRATVSREVVSNLERGEWASPNLIGKIAGVLGVSFEEIHPDFEQSRIHKSNEDLLKVAKAHRAKKDHDTGSLAPPSAQAMELSAKQAKSPTTHNLPGRSPFVVRGEVNQVKLLVREERVRVVIIKGPPGIGKTSLAIEAAYEISKQDDSGFRQIVWLSDRESPINLESLCNRVAYHAEELQIAHSNSLPFKKELTLKLLARIPTLLVLDNFESVTDESVLSFVSQVPEPSKLLITTSTSLDIRGHNVSLSELAEPLRRSIIDARIEELGLAELSNVNWRSIEQATGNPLVLLWAVGQVAKGGSVNQVAEQLSNGQGKLKSLIEPTWHRLPNDVRELAEMISAFPADVSADLLVPNFQTEPDDSISMLERFWFVEFVRSETQCTKLRMQPMTRAFIQQQCIDRQTLLNKNALKALEKVCCLQGGLLPASAGYEYIEAELDNIKSLIKWCGKNASFAGQDGCSSCLSIVSNCEVILWGRGYWTERLELAELAHEAASYHQWPREKALQSLSQAWIRYWQDDLPAAYDLLARAKSELGKIKDQRARAIIKRIEGLIACSKGRYKLAKKSLLQCLEYTLPKAIGVESRRAVMCDLGIVCYEEADFKGSQGWLTMAVKDAEQSRDEEGLFINQAILARTLLKARLNISAATELFETAFESAMKFRRTITLGRCNLGLAEIAMLRTDYESARAHLAAATEQFRRIGMGRELGDCECLRLHLAMKCESKDLKTNDVSNM